MSSVENHDTSLPGSIRRLWPLALLLLLVVGLAGCAEPEEEEAANGEVGAEEEAVGEEETPGFGLIALVGAVAAAAVALPALRRR